MIIGLTGRRGVGKTELTNFLTLTQGFTRVHPFEPGKVATRAYFEYLSATPQEAFEMTSGSLKDVPSGYLPRINDPDHGRPGENYSPRYFMERFGYFMGVDMGPAWTLKPAIAQVLKDNPFTDIIVESIVYEADALREMGGVVIGIERPDANVVGLKSDTEVAGIKCDAVIENTGTLDSLFENANFVIDRLRRMQMMRKAS